MLTTITHFVSDLTWSTIVLALIAAYYVYRHGLPWVVAKVKSIFSSASADYAAVAAVFRTDLAALEARIAALEATVKPAAAAPVAAPAAPAPAPAPAAEPAPHA